MIYEYPLSTDNALTSVKAADSNCTPRGLLCRYLSISNSCEDMKPLFTIKI